MKRTDQSLLEQLHISDVEISQRMTLLALGADELSLLSSHHLLIETHIESIVFEFYKIQTEIDEITLLIGDADTLQRLRDAQRHYVLDLFGGYYDTEYVNNRLRIGLVHKRIGVEPKLYLSAVRTLKSIITQTLRRHIDDPVNLEATLDALEKLIYFDTTLVFDTYINSLMEEIDTARNRVEIYAKSLEAKVIERTRQLETQAKIDSLTGIYNRRAMQDILRREMSLARRRAGKLAFVYFDVDDFKKINDQFGHLKGDSVLRQIGKVLINNLRDSDIASRYGGDEFCLILPDCEENAAIGICEKILSALHSTYSDVSLSMGLVVFDGAVSDMDYESIIRAADRKMYEAKKDPGFKVCH